MGPVRRVLGLDGQAKMSKSLGNTIGLLETPEEIWEKVRVGLTDPARKTRKDPGNPNVCNIFSLHRHFSSPEDIAWADEGCRTAGIGCIECKRRLTDNIIEELRPIRERAAALERDDVVSALNAGAERCRAIASQTMAEVRSRMGLSLPDGPVETPLD